MQWPVLAFTVFVGGLAVAVGWTLQWLTDAMDRSDERRRLQEDRRREVQGWQKGRGDAVPEREEGGSEAVEDRVEGADGGGAPSMIGVWRNGRHVGRTLYVQVGEEPSDADQLIGVMDTPELAAYVVYCVNVMDAGLFGGE